MIAFEPWITGVGSDRSTNRATTTTPFRNIVVTMSCFFSTGIVTNLFYYLTFVKALNLPRARL